MAKRMKGKKKEKSLTLMTLRTPVEAESQELWEARWLTLEENVLGHVIPRCPSGSDLRIFLLEILDIFRPIGPNLPNVISIRTLTSALGKLLSSFTFKFEAFNMTAS